VDQQALSTDFVHLVPVLVPAVLLALAPAAVSPLVGLLPYLQHLLGQLGTSLPPMTSRYLFAPQAFALVLWLLPAAPGFAQLPQSAWSPLA